MLSFGQTVRDVSCFTNPALDGTDVKILAIGASGEPSRKAETPFWVLGKSPK
jgi:hypothetical protein